MVAGRKYVVISLAVLSNHMEAEPFRRPCGFRLAAPGGSAKTKSPARGRAGLFSTDGAPLVSRAMGGRVRCVTSIMRWRRFCSDQASARWLVRSGRNAPVGQCDRDLRGDFFCRRRAVDHKIGGCFSGFGNSHIHPPQHRVILHVAREAGNKVGRGGR
jgi:hypothetical protein